MKKVLKIIGCLVGVILLVAVSYIIYVFADYYRQEDNLELIPDSSLSVVKEVPLQQELSVTSWNIGFGAYTDQYSFFMDGGKYSRAFSEESVVENINSIAEKLSSFNSDFYLIQEVDVDSTRSYHVNQYDLITSSFIEMDKVYAQNYDSPYLFYPLTEPHGKSKAGIVTLSDYTVTQALRRSLPIQSGFAKFLDLDRCYSISRIPVDGGKELILINFHLSAYTTDPTVADSQLEMLYNDITAEYKNGNYVICGGDFNKDLLVDSSAIFGVSGEDYSWAQSFPYDNVPEGFKVIAPYDEAVPVPSCRNADRPWNPETNFQLTIDGFIISDNVECLKSDVIDLQFAYSDHNPVYMNFKLN